jgi:hypothetical protein
MLAILAIAIIIVKEMRMLSCEMVDFVFMTELASLLSGTGMLSRSLGLCCMRSLLPTKKQIECFINVS